MLAKLDECGVIADFERENGRVTIPVASRAALSWKSVEYALLIAVKLAAAFVPRLLSVAAISQRDKSDGATIAVETFGDFLEDRVARVTLPGSRAARARAVLALHARTDNITRGQRRCVEQRQNED